LEQTLPKHIAVESNTFNRVSFVGGPYDGSVSSRRKNSVLCDRIQMPVSSNILRLLTGESLGDETPIRAVATYRLVVTPGGPRYRFHCFQRLGRDERRALTVWHHAMLSAWEKIKQQHRGR
jgi:hypothetical protein